MTIEQFPDPKKTPLKPPKEPILNIEDPAPFIIASILCLAHLGLSLAGDSFRQFAMSAGVLAADQGQFIMAGRPLGWLSPLLTHVLLHADWGHVLMNSAFIVIFGIITIRGVRQKDHLFLGRFRKGALVFLLIFLLGSIGGGVGQILVWVATKSTGLALGASTGGAALFATAAWVLGGRQYLLSFGIVLISFDVFSIMMGAHPSWAGHLGGYCTGAALAVLLLKPKSAANGSNNPPNG